MTMYAEKGGQSLAISDADLKEMIAGALEKIGGNIKKVLLIPPDFTRFNSYAGPITAMIYNLLKEQAEIKIIPALGTHVAMTEEEIRAMFGPDIPSDKFVVHDWRNDVVSKGVIPGKTIKMV